MTSSKTLIAVGAVLVGLYLLVAGVLAQPSRPTMLWVDVLSEEARAPMTDVSVRS